jgi:hypothetical protein
MVSPTLRPWLSTPVRSVSKNFETARLNPIPRARHAKTKPTPKAGITKMARCERKLTGDETRSKNTRNIAADAQSIESTAK